jgi:hypothetical protein
MRDYMTAQDDESYRVLKRNHQQLLRDWKRKKATCIICAQHEGKDRDHLPPKVLFPEEIRTQDTEFFTFPVCKQCNNSSSDEDFLFSVLLSLRLNQESILQNREPTDPDLLALDRQMQMHLQDPKKGSHRVELLRPFIGKDPRTGRDAINLDRLPVNQTLTKIVKSIYWLQTGGDILQQHRPGWWIRTDIDTSKENFIAKHLSTTHAVIHWGDRFIVRYTVGHPNNGVGGMILSSLHFYTKRNLGEGMSWFVIGSPSLTTVDGKSLYEMSKAILGSPTIEP